MLFAHARKHPIASALSLPCLSLAAALAFALAMPAAAAPLRHGHGPAAETYNGDPDDRLPAGTLVRERLGLSVQKVDPGLADALDLKSDEGVLVTAVLRGGAGEEAGLKRGDVILEVEDDAVRDAEALADAFAGIKPGREADLTVMRGMKTLELTLVPKRLPPAARWDEEDDAKPHGERLGLRVAEPDRRLRRRYGLGSGDGVVVLGVAEGGRAGTAGILEGDLIAEADRRPVRNPSDLLAAVERGRKRGKMVLLVRRGEDVLYVPIRFR